MLAAINNTRLRPSSTSESVELSSCIRPLLPSLRVLDRGAYRPNAGRAEQEVLGKRRRAGSLGWEAAFNAESLRLPDTLSVHFDKRVSRRFRETMRDAVVFDIRFTRLLHCCIRVAPSQVQIWQYR
jgi:hypothetical protein